MAIRVIALLFSVLGYYLFYYLVNKRRDTSFFYITYIAFVSVTMYLFGLIGHLRMGVYATVAIGLLMLLVSLIIFIKTKTIRDIARSIFFPSVLFVGIAIVWIYFITRNTGLSHYDDFTHWYRICKMMNIEGNYPTQHDMLFPSYVPGTATWIYYVTRFIGFNVGNCFFAQSLLNAFCCVALFAVLKDVKDKKHKIYGYFIIAITSIVLCAMNVGTYNLLVDTVIGLVALACTTVILVSEEERGIEEYLFLLIVLTYLAIVKNSGIIYVIFVAILWYKREVFYKEKDSVIFNKREILKAFILVVIPFVVTRLYSGYTSRVFGDITNTAHNVSIERYSDMVQGKSMKDIADISAKFLSEIFAFNGGISQVQIIWLSIFVILGIGIFSKDKKVEDKDVFFNLKFIGKFLLFTLIVYSLGLLFIYIFSMNSKEANATYLACLFRYMGTEAIFVFGIMVVSLLKYIYNNMQLQGSRAILTYILGVSIVLVGTYHFDIGYIWGFKQSEPDEIFTEDLYYACQQYVPEKMVYTGDSYVVIYDDSNLVNEYGKLNYVMQMHLRSSSVKLYTLNKFTNGVISEEEINQIKTYNYVVMLGDYSYAEESIKQYISYDEVEPRLWKINAQ